MGHTDCVEVPKGQAYPGRQSKHISFPGDALNFPRGHISQTQLSFWKLPWGHMVELLVDPGGQELPGLQVRQTERPGTLAKLPAGHVSQTQLSFWKLPGGHCDPSLIDPGGQL